MQLTESFRSSFSQHRFDYGTNLNRISEMHVSFQNSNFHDRKSFMKNHYHDFGNRRISCILSSIRMHCSKLNHVNNLFHNELCNCDKTETVFLLFQGISFVYPSILFKGINSCLNYFSKFGLIHYIAFSAAKAM